MFKVSYSSSCKIFYFILLWHTSKGHCFYFEMYLKWILAITYKCVCYNSTTNNFSLNQPFSLSKIKSIFRAFSATSFIPLVALLLFSILLLFTWRHYSLSKRRRRKKREREITKVSTQNASQYVDFFYQLVNGSFFHFFFFSFIQYIYGPNAKLTNCSIAFEFPVF